MTKKLATRAATQQHLLDELRGGPAGVKRFNARSVEERKQSGSFHGVDLSGAELPGVDLGSLDFHGATFDEANLADAWLRECNLKHASFKKANLKGAWCAGAKLQGADLAGASLAGCNLRSSVLQKATLTGADLREANLSQADLSGADLAAANLKGTAFDGTRYDEHTRWPRGFYPPEGLRWVGNGTPTIDFETFLKRLGEHVDLKRLGRALEMLKAERFKLFTQVDDHALIGVVKSQTDPNLVYSCRLASDGSFACCSQKLEQCLGLRGALCKHLLLLIVGLVRSGELGPALVDVWVRASRNMRPVLDSQQMSETLLRYKGAEAGEVDWRPTETIPEDYYAL